MANNNQLGRVVVHTPDMRRVQREDFTKPFILYDFMPQGTTLTDVVQLPNILDLIGLPSGGGPPGICSYEPHLEKKHLLLPEPRLIVAYPPGATIRYKDCGITPIGVCVTAGVVLSYFELILYTNKEEYNADSPEALEALIKEAGYFPIPLVEYETPPQIRAGRLDATLGPSTDGNGEANAPGVDSTESNQPPPDEGTEPTGA